MTSECGKINAAALRLAQRLSDRTWWHGMTVDYAAGSIQVYAKAGRPSAADLAPLDGGLWEGYRVDILPSHATALAASAN